MHLSLIISSCCENGRRMHARARRPLSRSNDEMPTHPNESWQVAVDTPAVVWRWWHWRASANWAGRRCCTTNRRICDSNRRRGLQRRRRRRRRRHRCWCCCCWRWWWNFWSWNWSFEAKALSAIMTAAADCRNQRPIDELSAVGWTAKRHPFCSKRAVAAVVVVVAAAAAAAAASSPSSPIDISWLKVRSVLNAKQLPNSGSRPSTC